MQLKEIDSFVDFKFVRFNVVLESADQVLGVEPSQADEKVIRVFRVVYTSRLLYNKLACNGNPRTTISYDVF